MNIIDVLNNRYSTKEFDPAKKISDEDFAKVKDLLRLSPSSTNLQPWHFVIAGTEEGKDLVAKSTREKYDFNTPKVLEASHVVIFCSRVEYSEDFLLKVLEKEDQDGRYPQKEFKGQTHGARSWFANMHRYDYKDQAHWMEKQVYLNLGNFLLGVAALGIDALPMEGLDMQVLDDTFGLREKGYTAICAVSIGYRKDNDFNATLPKSRLAEADVFTLA